LTTEPVAAGTAVPSDVILERLLRLHPKIIDLELDRVTRLLDRLGNPERRVAPVVHVAGTNGKGSVLATLRAILEAAGYKVHVYTSPHLVRFHERIRLAGTLIGENALAAALEECEAVNGGAPITFFEITTCAAFLCFARTPADAVLLETGLGGRLDATNVIARPRLTVITPVSIDHVQYLGDTLEAIAKEKAGIVKAGIPVVVGPQPAAAAAVIARHAAALGAPLMRAGTEWTVERTAEGLHYRGPRADWHLPAPRLPGPYQYDNTGTALACVELLDEYAVGPDALRRGLGTVEWPARMQRMTKGRLHALLPEGWELWLDGGHNAGAGQAIAAVLAGWKDRPLHLIYGMLNTKAADGFLKPLARHATSLRAVTIPGEAASLTAEEAAQRARDAGFAATPSPGVEAALADIVAREPNPARVLVCGSIYLAGRVLATSG
jgi:dihydrofolate synthase/folylpolyglutamate synthase